MTLEVPRLPFSVDPLIAEAKRRMRRRRLLLVAVLVAAIAAAGSVVATRSPGGPGSAGPPGAHGLLSGPGRVGSLQFDAAGRIGPLHMNRSTRAQVVAYAGPPDVFRVGKEHGRTLYRVLGYGCAPNAGAEKYWVAYPIRCRSAFYLVDDRLSLFFTTDPRFAESAGVRIGTPTKQAERLLHQRAFSGCTDAIGIKRRQTSLSVLLDGGTLSIVGLKHYLVGGHVSAFYLHGRRDTGATDCE